MPKKTVHIISHSHLDREWYMPFEAHRMRVVELFDAVLDLFDQDPNFKYFHVDGHTLPLDDYLEIRPEQRGRIQAAIDAGKLRIGPYYILQDAFLISEEANVRNALIGRQELDKWGVKGEQVGYFPDTFGLSGQIPQIVKETGLSYATFGRGVKPTGFNNTVGESSAFQSTYSEMNWKSPDETQILGILFANWYSNGNEIPTEEEAARIFWDQKLADAEKYAATDQLLMMNGCDHQPVQRDVSQAIDLANRLYPDYHFIHSNFEIYYESLPKNQLAQLSTVYGELRSQETEGWYTLANTASSRIYIKQRSHELSLRLEKEIEPLAVIAQEMGYLYPKDQLDFAWKKLLENYPHDSICGCSVDQVHRGMMTRFDQVEGVLDYLQAELLAYLGKFDFGNRPEEAKHTFQVWNTDTVAKKCQVKTKIEVERRLFKEDYPSVAYQKMADIVLPGYQVVDGEGNQYPASITDLGPAFAYDLPKDAFRIPYMARYIQVEVELEKLDALTVKQLYLVEKEASEMKQIAKQQTLENEWIKVTLDDQGSLDLYDKKYQRYYRGQCVFEETGDAGNEYIFKEAKGNRIYSYGHLVTAEFSQEGPTQILKTKYEWELPEAGDDLLQEEIKRVIDITNRKSGRSEKLIKQTLSVSYRLHPNDKFVKVRVEGHNDVKDHRIRMVWKVDGQAQTHWVDSHYEVLQRPNVVSKEWKNPSNPQVLRHGVAIYASDASNQDFGITVATKGLYEYEVYEDGQFTNLAVTLLRSTGELGDWGHFDTPEAQCIGDFYGDLAFCLWTGQDQGRTSLIEARYLFVDPIAYSPVNQSRQVLTERRSWTPLLDKLFSKDLPETVIITAIKKAQADEGIIIRLLNLGDPINLEEYWPKETSFVRVNLLEQVHPEAEKLLITNHQVFTLKVHTRE